jgi:hypothetical protein
MKARKGDQQPELGLPVRPHGKQIDNGIEDDASGHDGRDRDIVPPKGQDQIEGGDLEGDQDGFV